MRAFKSKWFAKFAEKEEITDGELWDTIKLLENEQADANLGGNVYKVRVARQGEGKSGGYRIIVFFRSEDKTFFIYGFAKSDMDNISQKELKANKEAAKVYFSLTDKQIEERIKSGQLIELKENNNEV